MIPDVAFIDLHKRLLWLDDGRCLPITTLLDHLNEETWNTDEAVTAVGGADGVGWFGIRVADFAPATQH